jgi:hypothetical protein
MFDPNIEVVKYIALFLPVTASQSVASNVSLVCVEQFTFTELIQVHRNLVF